MPFEDELAEMNESYFLREFTYSNTLFRHRPENDEGLTEVELADSLIRLGNSIIAYQLKERLAEPNTTVEIEERWFNRKVVYKGARQIRDTRQYLATHEVITLENHRGHLLDLRGNSIEKIHQLIVFKPHELLANNLRMKKFYISETAGIIHLIDSDNYLGIVQTLLTPAEIMDYLLHRESLIHRWGQSVNQVPEQSLVGHYLFGKDIEEEPSENDVIYLAALNTQTNEWDISGIMRLYADRIIRVEEDTRYYPILEALALLKRSELKLFKERFIKAKDDAFENVDVRPYRFAVPRLNLGFIFIPLPQEEMRERDKFLQILTDLNKYDLRLERCLGMVFLKEDEQSFFVDWHYIDYPWEEDEQAAAVIEDANPFREVFERTVPAYNFNGNEDN